MIDRRLIGTANNGEDGDREQWEQKGKRNQYVGDITCPLPSRQNANPA